MKLRIEGEPMRYEKAEQLLKLCIMMAARSQGVSIDMIRSEFEVSRRTAERMRDAALRLLPFTEERIDEDGFKFWRATDLPKGLATISMEELMALSAGAETMRGANRPDAAQHLVTVGDKLLAQQSRKWQLSLEPDLELQMQSEGIALRPGPKVFLSMDHLEAIRDSILKSKRLTVNYIRRGDKDGREIILEPYGILYGQRPYLLAKQAGKPHVRHYRLQGLAGVNVSDDVFIRDEGFDLHTYTRRLFGVFNETPFDVVWHFTPSAAHDAAEYQFHPEQTLEFTDDGSLFVRFKAAGALEMAWHLLTWGVAVEVVEPTDFWDRVGISHQQFLQAVQRDLD